MYRFLHLSRPLDEADMQMLFYTVSNDDVLSSIENE